MTFIEHPIGFRLRSAHNPKAALLCFGQGIEAPCHYETLFAMKDDLKRYKTGCMLQFMIRIFRGQNSTSRDNIYKYILYVWVGYDITPMRYRVKSVSLLCFGLP